MKVVKMVLRSMLLMTMCFLWNISLCLSDSDGFSTYLETAVEVQASPQLISGPNGHCIGVNGNNYNDGTSVILLPCNPNALNQLWTFQSDGTVQSKGKCLTADGLTQRSGIVISNCNTATQSATLWQLQSNGEIVNPTSGLALTALTGRLGTQLTLQKRISSSFQTWQVGNDTNPKLATIVGMNDLCLQLTGIGATLGQCRSGDVGQRWLVYPDKTIRPQGNTNHCLGFDNLPNRQVKAFTCGLGPTSQRNLFMSDDTILNERTNLVFDVVHSDPGVEKIIVYPKHGKPNQKWKIIFH